MTLLLGDLERLCCPDCHGTLEPTGSLPGPALREGELVCRSCHASWPVQDGLLHLFREEKVTGTDRLMRFMYDKLARLHDPAVRLLLPLMQSGHEAELRAQYLHRLELETLSPPADGRPVRILEVGIGTGANLAPLLEQLPRGLPAEIWGLDLSVGMLQRCRARIIRDGLLSTDGTPVRLLMANAHALPFPDDSFDRVFHLGGIGGFADPAAALAELGRVARPGTPIVVGDEALDGAQRHTLLQQLGFRLITFYDRQPHCPVEALPPGAELLAAEQLCRFYYGMTFRMPAWP